MRRALFALLLLTSCSTNESPKPKGIELASFQGTVMTVPYKIEIGDAISPADQAKIEQVIRSTFHEINAVYNKWNPDSEVARINQAEAAVAVPVSKELIAFLERCTRFVELSQGRFDPTVETIQNLWKQHLEEHTAPPRSEINRLKPAVGWHNLVIGKSTVTKKQSHTQIDLGGIAKGYAVDLLIERLQECGFRNLFVEWGGEIRAAGKHPQGRQWAVFISNLDDLNPEHALAYVPLSNQAIATSGDYLQQWKIGSKTYFHVFDPQTLYPLLMTDESIASATVLTKECVDADALATMLLMCKNMDEAKALCKQIQKKYPDAAFWMMSRKEIDK